jgi:hypothetical protein
MYLPNQIDATAKTCAEAHGFDWSALSSCTNGDRGMSLFKASEYFSWGKQFVGFPHK